MCSLTKCISYHEPADPSTTSCISLQHVNRAGLEHPSKVSIIVTIFAGRDIHSWRRVVADQTQAFEIIRGNRFFEPSHIRFSELITELERLLSRVTTIGVHEQFRFISDRGTSSGNTFWIAFWLATDFHFHFRDPLFHPSSKLVL